MVRTEQSGPVTTIILSRPEVRNAVDGPCALALADAFRAFEADPGASVGILWGEGGTFCSGADLKAFATDPARANRIEPDGDGPMGPTRMHLDKPMIAAISGHAVAGGLELACLCDLRIVEADAVMGVSCRRWGVPLIDGGTIRLPRLIGLSRALDLILTGRPVQAEEALQLGLANRIVPPGTARRAATELALQLAAFPQAALRADRHSAHAQAGLPLDEALRLELERGSGALQEAKIGASRFAAGTSRHGRFEPPQN
ncbi:MAG TPA: crotonase/enoyl-CoA hydratase family protein [Deltaproteobacteria bacterium]|nr:crotonase/enoyl-CoA hydratase family protein [Deltaproteobacteria bacterium]